VAAIALTGLLPAGRLTQTDQRGPPPVCRKLARGDYACDY